MGIKTGVAGASGYTGIEAVGLVHNHPELELSAVASNSNAGNKLSTIIGANAPKLDFCNLESAAMDECEIILSCLPHKAGMEHIKKWRADGKIVFDLSADFRMKDPAIYSEWYGVEHTAVHLLPEAVYGLPEVNRQQLKTADLVACAGCYPTAISLGLIPIIKSGIVEASAIVSAISGTTGAGRKADINLNLSEMYGSMQAYGFPRHRHKPEMEQTVTLASGIETEITFLPHLGGFSRGIYATITVSLKETYKEHIFIDDILAIYSDAYEKEPFVTLCTENPKLKDVVGTNHCHLRAVFDDATGKVVIYSAIDNLIKGSAGQAVQCLNIRFGWSEGLGL